uniref:Uncharacterized protein n=1 Tax=Anopheles coluzzii TaxID=1518534 RepID=A0A8W7PHR5_ANOCL
MPSTVSPTRFTSAATYRKRYLNIGSTWSGPVAYLQKHGCPMIGMPASFEIFCSCWVKLRSASSRTVRWGAKQAIAHTRISTPTRYLRRIVPQWVISILSPLISLVNLTRCESVSGLRCSLMSLMSSTSHMNSITGCAL